jgi:hypothetical protein
MTKPSNKPKPAPFKPTLMWAVVNNASGKIEVIRSTRRLASTYCYARAERIVKVRVEEAK